MNRVQLKRENSLNDMRLDEVDDEIRDVDNQIEKHLRIVADINGGVLTDDIAQILDALQREKQALKKTKRTLAKSKALFT